MGNRLSKIYTRTGDDGSTGLGDGSRVRKDHPRVEAMGDLDELNSLLGLALTEPLPDHLRDVLTHIQQDLFDLGGEISIPQDPRGRELLKADRVTALEHTLEPLNATLPPLKEFVLPGGTRAAALLHVARAVSRRAERRIHTLAQSSPVSPHALPYLNRLSDLLFVIARVLNRDAQKSEPLWAHNRGPFE